MWQERTIVLQMGLTIFKLLLQGSEKLGVEACIEVCEVKEASGRVKELRRDNGLIE
jgi:hypothetical protein